MYTHKLSTLTAVNPDNGKIETWYTAHILDGDAQEIASLTYPTVGQAITAGDKEVLRLALKHQLN